MAFAMLQLLVLALLGVGMIRARVLPVPAVALFTFSPLAALVTAPTLTAVGVDAARYVPLGIPLLVAGVMGVGWAMWREPSPSPN